MKQTIIITGGAGFIGSHFLNKFVLLFPYIDFINIDALTYAGNINKISLAARESKNYFFEQADIRDKLSLEKIYNTYKPTDIIHFAAESHVDNSIKNPMIFTETNIIGTQNLLELHKKYNCQRFHHISTDEVYGDLPNGGYFTEGTPLNPSNPYSTSKAAADMLVKAYGRTYGIEYVITRSSNNYGPNQNSEKLIPHFFELLAADTTVTLHGDGLHIRDWIYVQDHCDAIWEVFTRGDAGSTYNIGGGNEYTNLAITQMILSEMGKDIGYMSYIPDRAGNDMRYALDATKIKTELGWEPKIVFETGIKTTLNFYKNTSLSSLPAKKYKKMFTFTKIHISGVRVIEPDVHQDERGFFMESYCKQEFQKAGITYEFVQDNQSKSKAGVLRGLHFQTQHTQSKLVRVVAGSVYDVVVDMRKDSLTYGQWYGILLSAQNKKQLFVPKGCAHGFLTLEDDTEFVYKCDAYYTPEYDCGIAYDSPDLAIDWSRHYAGELIISERDKLHPTFADFRIHNPF